MNNKIRFLFVVFALFLITGCGSLQRRLNLVCTDDTTSLANLEREGWNITNVSPSTRECVLVLMNRYGQ